MTKQDAKHWQRFWEDFQQSKADNPAYSLEERLRQRAKHYAAPTRQPQTESEASTLTLLVFELDMEQYGVDATLVERVRFVDHITPVPGVPDFYRGVMNVRGQIITVMDLRRFFGMTVKDEVLLPDEVVVVAAQGLQIGLLSHYVRGVVSMPVAEVEPMDNMQYARGVTKDRLVLLDMERLLGDERLIVNGYQATE
jgi:purine-binding chemotaxis protein CheW